MAKTASSTMRRRITLQERVLVDDARGATELTWQDVGHLCASVEPLKGQEFFSSGNGTLPQKQAEIDTRIRIRYRTGLDPAKHRIIHGGIVHDLIAVIEDRGRGQTQLMVKATAAQQPNGGSVNA